MDRIEDESSLALKVAPLYNYLYVPGDAAKMVT